MTLDRLDTLGWPTPDPAALRRSDELVRRLRTRIERAGGSLPFSSYMQAVLYEPGLGYYAGHVAGFGPQGDFVTAPELSLVFAHCLGNDVGRVLDHLDSEAKVLELGAGSGALAAGLLHRIRAQIEGPIVYQILEPSAHLQLAQRERLIPIARDLGARVEWLSELPREPFDGVILANEVVDALPVERFQIGPHGPLPVHVAHDGERFYSVAGPPDKALARWYEGLERRLGRGLNEGYCSEVCRWAPGWVMALGATLRSGVALLFDYGYEERDYYHPERSDGTLLCHYRHRAHGDPYLLPGLQDVTASVDFSQLAQAGEDCDLELLGYTTQSWYLINNDLEGYMNQQAETELGPDYLALASAVRTLTMPGEMGERVKVLALARGLEVELPGFAARDLRGRL